MSVFHFLNRLSAVSLATTAATITGLSITETVSPHHPLSRSYRFWRHILPIYLHYKYVEKTLSNQSDPHLITAAYKPLHDRYSPIIERLTLDLRGFYFKMAQVMSTRDDFLPPQYALWTKKLQHKSPNVLSSHHIRAIVEHSVGVHCDQLFEDWTEEPIGAASVAQVHRAKWRETGETVAVKVQYPNIEQLFHADMQTVETFCKYLQPQHTPFFNEIKKQFATEFDARAEAHNLQLVRDNLYESGWNDLVDVPKPIYATKHVLIMSYLPGTKLVDGVREQFAKLAEMKGIDLKDMEQQQIDVLQSGITHNIKSIQRLCWVLGLRDAIMNNFVWLANNTIHHIHGAQWKYWQTPMPVNLAHIFDTLINVHGHELFFDGAFNGDPHPGNILLMPDGRLGLVDYGQVKQMSIADRIIYAKLIMALSRDDHPEIVRLAREEMGVKTKLMNEDILFRQMAFFHDRDTDDVTMGMNLSEFIDWMEQVDPIDKINDEFVMVGRVNMLLRGMANAFGIRLRMSDYWKVQAEQFLKLHGIDY